MQDHGRHLSSTARYIIERLPDLQTEEPIPIIHAEKLGIYGDGFIQFIHVDMRTSHTVFQMSVEDNNCLYNSISLVLWGHSKKTFFLRLAAAIYGIVNHEKMVDQVMEGIMDWNDAVAWVIKTTTAIISDDATMMQQPRHLVKSAIEKELFATPKGTDSAQVQFMSLAGLLRKKITVRNYNEDNYPCSKTSKSWRMRDLDSRSSHVVRRLTHCSGLNIPNESVVTAIQKFIEELLLNPLNTKIIDLVLFPEVLIHLMAAVEGISYLEAELLIQDSCQQKICY